MQSLPQRVQQDVQGIIAEIERITGLQSRWTGNLLLRTVNDPSYATTAGAKEWNCDISIRQDYTASVHYFHVCLHEAIHSVSVGLIPNNYILHKGFEEGVVEQCARLLSQEIAAVLGIPVFGGYGAYQTEINLLEDLRLLTSKPEREFYLGLLAVPLDRRELTVVHWIELAHPQKTRQQILRDIAPSVQGLH